MKIKISQEPQIFIGGDSDCRDDGASKITAEFSLDVRPPHQEDDLNTFLVKSSQKLNQHLISPHLCTSLLKQCDVSTS